MRTLGRVLGGATLAALLGTVRLFAQSEPVVAVDISRIAVESNQGSVVSVKIIEPGLGYANPPTVTFSGGGGSGAKAVTTLDKGTVSTITVTDGGSGYTSMPTVTLSAPDAVRQATATATIVGGIITGITITDGGAGYAAAANPQVVITGVGGVGSGASATATVANGAITNITLTSGGTGYTGATVTVAPPTGQLQALAGVDLMGAVFTSPNESYGPYGTTIDITAAGRGTFLVGSFTYEWFVNGTSIGKTPGAVHPPATATAYWTPPQPGAYLLTASINDGGNKATSLAVRYFATGTAIVGPVDGQIVPYGSSVVIQATATPAPIGPDAFIQRMEFWIDGALKGTDYTYPYSMIYTPATNTSTHSIVAKAYDNLGNLVSPTATRTLKMYAPVGTPPTVRLLNPIDNSSTSAGTSVNLIADAVSATGYIKNVDFYVNGVALSSSQTFPFTSTWKSQVPGQYQFVAIAYDDKSNAVASTPINVTVTGGFPTVEITSPQATDAAVIQGNQVTIQVKAGGADGGISSLRSIELLVDGNVNDALPKNPGGLVPPPPLAEPFNFTWKSNVAIGVHKLAARVTDANGLIITSSEVPVNVQPNHAPKISITGPANGSSSAVNTPVTITAAASDEDAGTPIAQVEFFVDNASIGAPVTTATNGAYQLTWTPKASGTFVITAKATDSAGATTVSSGVTVTVDPAPAGGGGGSNSVFGGDYGSPAEVGEFAMGVTRNGRGTFIGFSTVPAGQIYLWTDIAINADGTFEATDPATGVKLKGQTGATGVSGTFGDKTFIGPITIGSTSPLILSGSLTGNAGSTVIAILGADNTVTVYTAAGSARDAGTGIVSSAGLYTIKTPTGGTYSGVATAASGLVSGTATGATNGAFLVRQIPSRLVNISMRALAGTSQGTLIAGFAIGGSGTKPLLVRAVGPSLVSYGIDTFLPNPSLSVVSTDGVTTRTLASNDDWNDSATLRTLGASVGAFPLLAGSKDSALQTALSPGLYSAMVNGASTPGVALIEVYDTERPEQGTARLANISARAYLGSGETLISGFVISGDTRKKVLIRAVGPSLANYSITNYVFDPKFDVMSGSTVLVSNDNWSGGPSGTVGLAGASVSAFPLNANSTDAALVVELSPGAYTVQASGVNGSSGIILLELYDLDK
jgi:hypothetical protein